MKRKEALDAVKTILGLNAAIFAKATIYSDEDRVKYLKIRDAIAEKIVDVLEIKPD